MPPDPAHVLVAKGPQWEEAPECEDTRRLSCGSSTKQPPAVTVRRQSSHTELSFSRVAQLEQRYEAVERQLSQLRRGVQQSDGVAGGIHDDEQVSLERIAQLEQQYEAVERQLTKFEDAQREPEGDERVDGTNTAGNTGQRVLAAGAVLARRHHSSTAERWTVFLVGDRILGCDNTGIVHRVVPIRQLRHAVVRRAPGRGRQTALIDRSKPSEPLGMVIGADALTIHRVQHNTPASRAGVQVGWRVLTINGTSVASHDDCTYAVAGSTAASIEVLFATPAVGEEGSEVLLEVQPGAEEQPLLYRELPATPMALPVLDCIMQRYEAHMGQTLPIFWAEDVATTILGPHTSEDLAPRSSSHSGPPLPKSQVPLRTPVAPSRSRPCTITAAAPRQPGASGSPPSAVAAHQLVDKKGDDGNPAQRTAPSVKPAAKNDNWPPPPSSHPAAAPTSCPPNPRPGGCVRVTVPAHNGGLGAHARRRPPLTPEPPAVVESMAAIDAPSIAPSTTFEPVEVLGQVNAVNRAQQQSATHHRHVTTPGQPDAICAPSPLTSTETVPPPVTTVAAAAPPATTAVAAPEPSSTKAAEATSLACVLVPETAPPQPTSTQRPLPPNSITQQPPQTHPHHGSLALQPLRAPPKNCNGTVWRPPVWPPPTRSGVESIPTRPRVSFHTPAEVPNPPISYPALHDISLYSSTLPDHSTLRRISSSPHDPLRMEINALHELLIRQAEQLSNARQRSAEGEQRRAVEEREWALELAAVSHDQRCEAAALAEENRLLRDSVRCLAAAAEAGRAVPPQLELAAGPAPPTADPSARSLQLLQEENAALRSILAGQQQLQQRVF